MSWVLVDQVSQQGETKMLYELERIDQIKQASALKRSIKQLIQQELEDGMAHGGSSVSTTTTVKQMKIRDMGDQEQAQTQCL